MNTTSNDEQQMRDALGVIDMWNPQPDTEMADSMDIYRLPDNPSMEAFDYNKEVATSFKPSRQRMIDEDYSPKFSAFAKELRFRIMKERAEANKSVFTSAADLLTNTLMGYNERLEEYIPVIGKQVREIRLDMGRLIAGESYSPEAEGAGAAIGHFMGDTAAYLTVGKLVGFLPGSAIKTGLGAATNVGITSFGARLIQSPGLKHEEGLVEDAVDHMHSALKSGAYGYAISGVLGGIGSLIAKTKGPIGEWVGKIGASIKEKLGEQASQSFKSAVQSVGGEDNIKEAIVERAKVLGKEVLREENAKKIIHIITGKKGLDLARPVYENFNIQLTGEASTSEMNLTQMTKVKDFYRGLMVRGAENSIRTNQTSALGKELTGLANTELGFISRFSPEEAVMRRVGLQDRYEDLYGAVVKTHVEAHAFGKVMDKFEKLLTPKEKEQMFVLNETTMSKLTDTPIELAAKFSVAAKKLGISEKVARMTTYLRTTSVGNFNDIMLAKTAQGVRPIDLPHFNETYQTHLFQWTIRQRGGMSANEWQAFKNAKYSGKVFNRFLLERSDITEEQKNMLVRDPILLAKIAYRAARKVVNVEPETTGIMNLINKSKVVIPTTTREHITTWIDRGVLEKLSPLDRDFNASMHASASMLVNDLRAAGYLGIMAFNPKSVVENSMQQTLNYANLGKYWLKGLNAIAKPMSELTFRDQLGNVIKTGMRPWAFTKTNSDLFKSRAFALMEGMDVDNMHKAMNTAIKIGMAPHELVEYANVTTAFIGGVQKYLAEGKTMQEAIKLGDRIARNANFNYLRMETPLAFQGTGGKLVGQFASYYTRYTAEVLRWGEVGAAAQGTNLAAMHGVKKGVAQAVSIPKSQEFARYFAINAVILAALKASGVGMNSLVLRNVGPTVLPTLDRTPPAIDFLLGVGQSVIGGMQAAVLNDKQSILTFKKGLNKMKKGIFIHTIPAYVSLKRVYQITQPDIFNKETEKFFGVTKKLPPEALITGVSEEDHDTMARDMGLY